MKTWSLCLIYLMAGEALATSSLEMRKLKQYEASLQYGADYQRYPWQLMLARVLDEKQVLGIKMGLSNAAAISQFNFGLQYKYFTGNSFYFAAEVYYLNYESVNFFQQNKDFNALGLGLRLGNQWHWQHFTLGVDWLGIGRNLIFWRKDNGALAKSPTVTVLNGYIGLAF